MADPQNPIWLCIDPSCSHETGKYTQVVRGEIILTLNAAHEILEYQLNNVQDEEDVVCYDCGGPCIYLDPWEVQSEMEELYKSSPRKEEPPTCVT